ncbi:MAG: hypothetical protein AAF502_09080 [Bacteroidota bacterium]
MKFSKSPLPYLVLALLFLVGLPILNHKTNQTQTVTVKVENQNLSPDIQYVNAAVVNRKNDQIKTEVNP